MAAGLAFMTTRGAPLHYLAINAGMLVAAAVLVLAAPPIRSERARFAAAGIALAVLALPLLVGPELNGVQRWIAIGPIALNSALLAAPALAVLAAGMDPRAQFIVALAVLAAAVAQPDASLALAVGGAAIGVALATRETRPALVAIGALLAAIWAHKRGNLPPQPFVERIYVDAAMTSTPWLVLLVAASIACVVLIAIDPALHRTQRFALAGSMSAFFYAAAISDYPTPLIGYGAAAILGLALALWLARGRADHTSSG